MIVVDINNPSDCQYCPMSDWGFHGTLVGCNAKGQRYFTERELSTDGKPDWCPIMGELNIEEFSDNADKIGRVIERLVSIGRKIKIGDECHYKDQSDNFIITRIYYEVSKGFFDAIREDGSVIYDGTLELIEKTGRNFREALTNFLQEMEG